MFALSSPDSLPFPAKLSLVFCLGYGVSAVISFVLTAIGVLNPFTLLAVITATTAVLYLVASKRFGLRSHVASLVDEVTGSTTLRVGLIVLVGFALYRAAFPAELNFLQSTAFRYWADGAEIADVGSLPDQVTHWGSSYPPTTSKVVVNSFIASLIFIFGDNPLSMLGPLLWLASVGLAVTLWGLAHELGLVRTGAFVPIFLLANPGWLNPEFTGDLTTFKTEIVGRMVAATSLMIGIRALRRRSWSETILAGLLLALAALTHITPFVVVVIALICFGLSLLLIEQHHSWAIARGLGIIFVIVVPLVIVVPSLARGDLGFEGITNPDAHVALAKAEDPTAFFAAPDEHLTGAESIRTQLPSNLETLELYVSTAFGKHVQGWGTYLLLTIFVLVSVGIGMSVTSRIRYVGFVAWGLGAGLILLTFFFLVQYETYIPAATGLRRLFDYNALVVLLVLMALVELGLAWIQKRAEGNRAVPVVTVVIALIVTFGSILSTFPSPREVRRTAESSNPFEWLRHNTPCGARVLASIRTEGVFQAVASRIGVLEGMSPYLRPGMLREVNARLTEAHRFFDKPRDGAALLREWDVHYVFLKGEGALGGSRITSAELERLGVPFLREVYSDDLARIYRVAGSNEDFPDRPPGYFCDDDDEKEASYGVEAAEA